MESSERRINEKAILVSKVLKPKQGGQCLKFYYTMFGKTMGHLKVQVTQNGVPKKTLFFRRGNQGRDWVLGTATLKNIQGNFKVCAGKYYMFIENQIQLFQENVEEWIVYTIVQNRIMLHISCFIK